MTIKQRLITFLYPLIRKVMPGKHGANGRLDNVSGIEAKSPFFALSAVKPDGTTFSLNALKGKKVIVVNTASDCGFTPQYKELEKLYQQNKDRLAILAFPSNDFKGQEPGSDKEIASFCEINYGVTFPLFKKDSVLNPAWQKVYDWLSDKTKNGWNEQAPTWNFCKYLIDEHGNLQAVYGPEVSPLEMNV